MNKQIVVKQGEPPIPMQIIASSIKTIADSFEKMQRSGLTQKAILILISHASGVSQTDVRHVLDGISQLKSLYLTKKI